MKTLVHGNRGQNVKDSQYLLTYGRFGNFHPGALDGNAGEQWMAAINRAKYALGYPKSRIHPVFGEQLYNYLLPRGRTGWKPLPPTYRARRIKRLKAAQVTKRVLVCDYARWGIKHEREISYAQVRPIPSRPWSLPMHTDCSGFATLAYKAAGANDPNHNNYDGSGNTSTLEAHGIHVSASALRPADLVFYDHPDHVGIYMGDKMVIEHGSSAGPRWEPYNYRTVTHCRSYLP